jgi:pimeloyl-ACP methyl ester carboxylesterase
VRALLDSLGTGRAAVLGWSMGGQYALACAALLPGRLSRTSVIAACLPLDDDATFGALNAMDRRFTRLERVRGAGYFLGYAHTTDILRSLMT